MHRRNNNTYPVCTGITQLVGRCEHAGEKKTLWQNISICWFWSAAERLSVMWEMRGRMGQAAGRRGAAVALCEAGGLQLRGDCESLNADGF